MCRGSVSVKRDGRGGTEMSVKITREKEENRRFEIGAYMAIMERILIAETKKRREERRRKGGV